MIDLHAIQTRVEALIRQAGKKIADTSASPIHKKAGHYNLVTDTDVVVEEFLKQELLALLPDSRFFAEEQENEALRNNPVFSEPVAETGDNTEARA